jgi:hypothetical protein
MTARRSRIRLFAGCALFALAIGAAIIPSLAFAEPAGRLPAPVRQAVVETTSAAPTGPTATQQAPNVALPPVAQRFFAAVRANFAQWDLNHDGRLTREEIEIDMQDARIKGEAAAALAALKIGATKFDKLDETRDFSVADIDEMERTMREGRKLDANFIGYFNVGLRKLDETPRELFAQGQPHMTAMRQYFTSDCYFLSAVGAIAETNPTVLVKLITTEGAGTYVVRFPGQPAVRVSAPTDSEIATYTAAKDGVWLSVLQKAYANVRIRTEPKEAKTRQPLDSVGFRLGSTSVMELLTGNPSRAIRLGAESDKGATGPMVSQLRSTLTAAFRDRRAVTASMSHHAYAITAYDPAADLVTIHNPYNSAGFETLPEGNKVRRSDDGFFTISTAQFASSFYYLRVQQGGRARS